MSFWLQENYHLFIEINHVAGRFAWLDALMIFCANTAIFLWPFVLLLLWGRPRMWRKQPLSSGEEVIIRECRATVLWMIGACLLAYGLNLGVEHWIFEPRPFVSHVVHLLISHPADDSFPSDHTAVSFAFVGMLFFTFPLLGLQFWRRRGRVWQSQGGGRALFLLLVLMICALLLACSIGLARVFVGVHYPGDILGGALSGLSAAGIATLLRSWLAIPTQAAIRFAERIRLA